MVPPWSSGARKSPHLGWLKEPLFFHPFLIKLRFEVKGGSKKKQHCRTEPSPVLRNYCRPGTISKWMEPCGWWAMSTSQATKQGSEDLIMDEYGQGFFTYLWSLIPERKTFQQPAKPSTPPKNGSTSSELKMSPARSAPGNSAKAPMNMGVGSESGPVDL